MGWDFSDTGLWIGVEVEIGSKGRLKPQAKTDNVRGLPPNGHCQTVDRGEQASPTNGLKLFWDKLEIPVGDRAVIALQH